MGGRSHEALRLGLPAAHVGRHHGGAVGHLHRAPLRVRRAAVRRRRRGEGRQPSRCRVVEDRHLCAIAGALAAFLGQGALFGGGLSLPRFTDIHVGATELLWLVPLALVGAAGGWLFCAFDGLFERLSERMGERPVAKALIAGLVLALMGIALPFTMFAGETQAEQLGEVWGVMRQPLMTVLLLFLCFP
ncbi:MAG: chloride channel protein [Eggerthella lenta]